MTIAALYVAEGGCYFGLEGVDPWDEARDARLYAGPWPVVAHPPCARWSRLAGFCEHMGYGKRGEDGGCFAAALASVRKWGGVLEHPAHTAAWKAHGLIRPGRGAWTAAGDGGWTCEVDQANYGHLSRKPTWLYAFGVDLPSLIWARGIGAKGFCSDLATGMDRERLARRKRTGEVQRLSHNQRIASPPAFRDLLLSIAKTAARSALSETGS